MTQRTSSVAYVLIRLRVDGSDCLLLREHAKWRDWSLVGGHVEPEEQHDWFLTAMREANEELAPLSAGVDFDIIELPIGPEIWGPEPSRSAGDEPTVYRARWYALSFRRDPTDCLQLIPSGDFLLASFRAIESAHGSQEIAGLVRRLARDLEGGLRAIPLAWPESLPAASIDIAQQLPRELPEGQQNGSRTFPLER